MNQKKSGVVMKQIFYFFVLTFCFFLLHQNLFANYIQNEDLKAYLTISFENPIMFNDVSSKSMIESKIKNIFENEGVHIIHEEQPEEYKLNINIIIKDSLVIEANSIGIGGGDATIKVKHPRSSYSYKDEAEIYNSIKSYIKKIL
jgi:hypothetical protein